MGSRGSRAAWAVLAALLISPHAAASGFQLHQQGAKAAGRGNAFTAQADDASAVYYNPAATGRLEGWTGYLGGSVIMQDTSFDSVSGTSVDMQDASQIPAQVYLVGRLSENYAIAMGAFNPYGIRTHWWSSDPVANSALKTVWDTQEYNFNFVANLGPSWAVALGYEFVRMHIKDSSRAYDFTFFSGFLFPPSEPLSAEENVIVDGDKSGFNVAIHYQGEKGNRFGLSFRSQKILRLSGRLAWQDVSEAAFLPGTSLEDPSGCPPSIPCPMGAAFTDSPATTTIVLPPTVQIGFGQSGRGRWDWEADVVWAHWEKFDSLDVEVERPNGIVTGPVFLPTTFDRNQTENWSDTWSIFAGTDYHVNDAHTVRWGLSFEPSAVDDELARPYNPESDRFGLSAGYGWQGAEGRLKVDAYVAGTFYGDAAPAAATRDGVVAGSYDTQVLSAGASIQYRF